jgi:cell division protein ZapA
MDSAAERKSVRVTIYNQSYTLAASGEPGEIETLAQTVDDLMTSISAASASRSARSSLAMDAQRVAVLACLHLADKLQNAERELAAVRERVDHKARQLSLLLDQTGSFDASTLPAEQARAARVETKLVQD